MNKRQESVYKMEYTHVKATFLPVYDEESRILILGSFPSVKSRQNQFYYGHPQNRFWKVIAGIFKEPLPQTIDEKKELLLRHRIAAVSYTHLDVYKRQVRGETHRLQRSRLKNS